MPLYSNTADALIRRTFMILEDWREGTCTGGTTTTFADTARNEVDDFFQNTTPISRVRIRKTTDSAAPVGEEREISDWVQSTGTGTVSVAFTVAPANGDTYAIFSKYRWDEVLEALNTAIDGVKSKAVYDASDESLPLVADVYEYPVPTGFLVIYRIAMSDGDGQFPEAIPPDNYKIIRGLPTPRIHFFQTPIGVMPDAHYYSETWAETDMTADRVLRIEGLKMQDKLVNDTDMCYINPAFLCYQAAALLHAERIRRPENEPDDHRAQYQVCQGLAKQFREELGVVQMPPNSKRVMS